jgi:hypothetical protein
VLWCSPDIEADVEGAVREPPLPTAAQRGSLQRNNELDAFHMFSRQFVFTSLEWLNQNLTER